MITIPDKRVKIMKYDFHSHFLPGIDDGARDVSQSVAILEYLASRGIEKVLATPHHVSHHESVRHFLDRREHAFNKLEKHINTLDENVRSKLPKIELGAEVLLEKDICEKEDIEKLAIGDSRYVLIELPLEGYKDWMSEEIFNLIYQFGIVPIMAHVNRYYSLYSKSEYEQLFSSEQLVLQLNCESLIGFSSTSRTKKLIKSPLKVVFGCDIHSPAKAAESGLDRMLALINKLTDGRKNELCMLEDSILG